MCSWNELRSEAGFAISNMKLHEPSRQICIFVSKRNSASIEHTLVLFDIEIMMAIANGHGQFMAIDGFDML